MEPRKRKGGLCQKQMRMGAVGLTLPSDGIRAKGYRKRDAYIQLKANNCSLQGIFKPQFRSRHEKSTRTSFLERRHSWSFD